MVQQLGSAMETFEKRPGCIGLFCFDQSSIHRALPPDALAVRKLTLDDKMTNENIKPGYFELNERHANNPSREITLE
ncbi:hypothetical protein LIPSTDRAFT_69090 [Lipomyces starkeyi NRRL Y-11557]|uniref:Uncharacterized protein n=1 Tax=Lipomyces starkeyi NRRL Y-11557 TaxID=675824 RepID=A0A1E3QD57_LIPST|nr:hypothetical protein LIPSTDRAFT_69090 [Lipomyces starkeyi NRRL Y-11557]